MTPTTTEIRQISGILTIKATDSNVVASIVDQTAMALLPDIEEVVASAGCGKLVIAHMVKGADSAMKPLAKTNT